MDSSIGKYFEICMFFLTQKNFLYSVYLPNIHHITCMYIVDIGYQC